MIGIIVFFILGLFFVFLSGVAIMDEQGLYTILCLIFGLAFVVLGCFFVYQESIKNYKKYIPNLQEQVLQGKMLELENKLKELE